MNTREAINIRWFQKDVPSGIYKGKRCKAVVSDDPGNQ